MTNQRGSIIPAIAVIFGVAVATLIFGYMLWPKDSDVNITGIDVRKVVKNENANSNANANTNANVNNANANGNVNASADTTKDWKTYTNTDLGYTLKFPPSWDGYTTSTGQKDGYTFARFTHPKQRSDKGNQGSVSVDILYFASKSTALPIGLKLIKEVGDAKYAYAPSNAAAPEEMQALWDQIDDIVGTFEATNPTAGWKTYENKTFGWTVKYPKTWELMDYTSEDETPDVELIFNKGASGLQKFFTDKRSDTLEEWKQKLLGGLTGVTTTVTEITIGGVNAIRVDTNVLDNLTYIGFRKGDVFVNAASANAALVTSDILSTFTFTK